MEHRKTKGNWVRPSLNPMGNTRGQSGATSSKAINPHPTAPWEVQSDELVGDFERDLQLLDTEVKHPWAIQPEDVAQLEAQKAYAKEYHFESMFAPQPLSQAKQRQIAEYKMNPPFLTNYNYQEEESRPPKKLDSERKNPKTKNPWEYGAVPQDPVRRPMHERPKTALWDNLDADQQQQQGSKKNGKMVSSGDPILDNLRSQLHSRGAAGLIGLSKKFRIMDDDGSGTLNYEEFRKGMKESGFSELTERALKHLFLYFDRDDSGTISYDEFLIGIRGQLNERRKALVALAFRILDKDKSGSIELSDIIGVYNVSMHPEVIAGKLTETQALQQFLSSFEQNTHAKSLTKGDNVITLQEFEEYYSSLSASIDDDDYFELMIRNAWHISGGANAMCSNTTNRRVLVTIADGTQSVREVENDIGISAGNTAAIFQKLQSSGNGQIATINMNGREGMSNQIANPNYIPTVPIASNVGSDSGSARQSLAQNRKPSIVASSSRLSPPEIQMPNVAGKPQSLTQILTAQTVAGRAAPRR